ncbi:hypothetical protein [Paenibacillus sp. MMS18-CY102]|uniref:hypothetical protein n=1 Tax=Paenibacillus sp. MMS18-CY102 TaxID=2682849 RepID=UPI00136666C2|nr:hypothetical protein [Paenibacillus sp. MMS18-CY102]
MEDLISFLLHNIYIVVVVLGFLFSIFNKSGKNKGKNWRMPEFGNGNQHPARSERPERPVQVDRRPTEAQPLAEAQPQMRQQTIVEVPAVPATVAVGVAAALPVQRTSAPTGRPSHLSPAAEPAELANSLGESQDELKPTLENVRQAILWSEILGPPRAKRPFRR